MTDVPPKDPLEAISAQLDALAATGGDLISELQARTKAIEDDQKADKTKLRNTRIGLAVALVGVAFAIVAGGIGWHAADVARDTQMRQDRRDAIDAHDRCVSGNDTRAGLVAVSVSGVVYIDTLLQAFGTFTPRPDTLTDEEQAQYAVILKKVADARQAQLDKINADELKPRDCDKLYPVQRT